MRRLLFLVAFAIIAANIAAAQDSLIKEYRGVFIGTERAQVHEKLGKPDNDYPREDSFELSDSETARVFYDESKKVRAIVITYAGKLDSAPKPAEVLGEAIEPGPDGGMYKMVRAEDKGFWVSYVKTAGDNPTIMITVQALKSS